MERNVQHEVGRFGEFRRSNSDCVMSCVIHSDNHRYTNRLLDHAWEALTNEHTTDNGSDDY